jgi:activating signal cointegrator 1
MMEIYHSRRWLVLKVITLIQPWASLIALGEKKIETRSWKTSYRGPLLIHAGKKIDSCAKHSIFRRTLESHRYTKDTLPTGMIIAKCNLIDCLEMVQCGVSSGTLSDGTKVYGNEYQFGNYEIGRYAWILDNVEMLKEPIPAKGKLSIWNFEGEI